jgi:acetamidase/formamidase
MPATEKHATALKLLPRDEEFKPSVSRTDFRIGARAGNIREHFSTDSKGDSVKLLTIRYFEELTSAVNVFKVTMFALGMSAVVLAGITARTQVMAATYTLKATPKTVAWGYYDAAAPPVLRIKSGDSVEIQTLLTSEPDRLEGAGVAPDQVEQSLRDIVSDVKDKGPGGHILTGPIYVEGAEPGDVLEVRILSIKLAIPYAYNGFGPRSGIFPNEFPYQRMKIIPLDASRMMAHFADGIDIPLHPFFGSMGVAPPSGRVSSGPPWIMAGNLDNKELVAGTTLYIPIHARGALFEVGDGHANEGDGEVDVTALETSLLGAFQFVVRKDLHFHWPRAETPTHYITMGLDPDLNKAAKMAVREMLDFLTAEKHLSRDDAYMLASSAADLRITQVVDGTKGAHMMIPKNIFTTK